MKKNAISRILSTGFGTGYLPGAPGTFASLFMLPVCIVLHPYTVLNITVFLFLFFIGVFVSDKVEKETGRKDPQFVVVDEYACILLIFLFMNLNIPVIITGFLIYRVLDILKIPPMNLLENVPGGWGIMLDDLMGALYTNLILQILMLFRIF